MYVLYVCKLLYIHAYIHVSPLDSGDPEWYRLCDEIPDNPAEVPLQPHEPFDLLGAIEEHVELPVQVNCTNVYRRLSLLLG